MSSNRRKRTAKKACGGGRPKQQMSQVLWLKCSRCDEEKSTRRFSMSERDRGSFAKCIACVEDGNSLLKCSVCHEKKHKWNFCKHEIEKGKEAKCADCEVEEISARLRVEALERERQERLEEQERIKTNGIQIKMPSFEFPGFSCSSDEIDVVDYEYDCPQVDFMDANKDPSSIVGTYDLVFFAQSVDGEGSTYRTVRGKLVIDWKSSTVEEHLSKTVLGGSVVFDRCVKNFMYPEGDFTFEFPPHENTDGDFKGFKLSSFENDLDNGKPVLGTLERVATATPVRYCPENITCEGVKSHEGEYAQSIHFDTIADAKALSNGYSRESLAWLANHTVLPEEVSIQIWQFCRSKPPPVFVFEKGDLRLEVDWDGWITYLVARKVQQS